MLYYSFLVITQDWNSFLLGVYPDSECENCGSFSEVLNFHVSLNWYSLSVFTFLIFFPAYFSEEMGRLLFF